MRNRLKSKKEKGKGRELGKGEKEELGKVEGSENLERGQGKQIFH